MAANLAGQYQYPAGLLKELQQAQRNLGYLPADLMADLASSLGLPLNDVYGVATFYSFLSTRTLGRNVIRVCKSVPCYLKENHFIVQIIKNELGIGPGETTGDSRFSLELTNCIGQCDKAPAMLVNGDPHVGLDAGKIANVLQNYH